MKQLLSEFAKTRTKSSDKRGVGTAIRILGTLMVGPFGKVTAWNNLFEPAVWEGEMVME